MPPFGIVPEQFRPRRQHKDVLVIPKPLGRALKMRRRGIEAGDLIDDTAIEKRQTAETPGADEVVNRSRDRQFEKLGAVVPRQCIADDEELLLDDLASSLFVDLVAGRSNSANSDDLPAPEQPEITTNSPEFRSTMAGS